MELTAELVASMDIGGFLGEHYSCACGKDHFMNMDNIFIRTDPAGNIKADKAKSTEKIDGAIALIMALDRAIRCGNVNGESVYEGRGLLVF